MTKKVDSTSSGIRLTTAEAEVLHYLTNELLTPRQVALRRRTSRTAVYKIIKNLKKKGVVNRQYQTVDKSQSTVSTKRIRLHGQEFNIKLLWKSSEYKKRKNISFNDGNTIRLYKDSIEVYSGKYFYANSVQEATAKSFRYWQRFFAVLENDYNIIIVKPRKQNIDLVNHHYAEINNGIARELNIKAEKLSIQAKEDGKVWFKIDNSFNMHEAETLHPKTAKQDMGKVKDVFNDIRENEHLKLSELSKTMAETANQVKEIASAVNANANTLNAILNIMMPPNGKMDKPDYMG